MASLICGIQKSQQTSECDRKEADPQIQRTDQVLPVWGGCASVGWEVQATGCERGSRACCAARGIHPMVQCSSAAQSCPTLCHPMNCSTPGLPVHHQLPEFTQTHTHPVHDAIQPSHPLSSPSPPAPNPSQHQSFPKSQLFT